MEYNLNKELYKTELLEDWTKRTHLINAEKYFIEKYLTNKTKRVLEAGTGGGRIAFKVEEAGFKNICAFDIVPQMIDYAIEKANRNSSQIKFSVADASNLNLYKDESFSYLIYLQQVLCFIPNENDFYKSLEEAFRIASKDSITIFSFLDFEGRKINRFLSLISNFCRLIRGEKTHKQYLPWLKKNNKINWKILNKNQALTYWIERKKVVKFLKSLGYEILEEKSSSQIIKPNAKPSGMLYIVCKK